MKTAATWRAPLGDRRDWQAIVRGWPVLVLTAAAAAALAWTYAAVIPPVYESEVRVLIQNLGLGVEKTNASKGYEKQFLATQAEVIRSPTTIARSLKSLPAAVDGTSSEAAAPSDPVASIAKALRVTPLAGTDIVRIVYQHRSPAEATARLESLVESYREHLRQAEQTSASQTAELLKRRADELTNSIRQLEQELVRVRSTTTNTSAGESASESPLLKELVGRWVDTQSELVAASFDLRDLEQGRGDWRKRAPSPAQGELLDLERQVIAARSEALEVSRIYGPTHPERRAFEDRLAALEAEFASLKTYVEADVRTQQNRLSEQEASLQQLMLAESERLRQAHGDRLEAQRLETEIARLSELHASTAATLESVLLADQTLSEGRSSVVVDVLDKFVVPDEPVWPKPVPLTVAATLLGVLATACGLVFFDRWRKSGDSMAAGCTSSSLDDQSSERAVQSQVEHLQHEVRESYARC